MLVADTKKHIQCNTFVFMLDKKNHLFIYIYYLLIIYKFLTIVSLQTDSAILGGMIVSIGDKYVDMSTKTKIQKLTKLIKET